jgi:DNA-binding GntR family transcriptional regulator
MARRPADGAARVVDFPAERPRRRLVRRQSLHAQATDQLRDMIVEGELAPGARIGEAELCAQLGISRTPLREALKVLASEGLVELLPHRGARVTQVTAEQVGELFEVIAALEGLAAELAARRLTDRDLERLQAMHDRMAQCHAERRRHDYFRLNHKMHQLIVALAGNGVLAATHEQLMVRARRSRYQAILSLERWDEAMAEHVALMDALSRRDADLAGALWRRHVARTGEVVRAALAAGGPAGGPRQLYAEG